MWVPAPDGSPGAVLWGHVSNHVDRYLGAWSKPGNGTIYISGYQTAEQWRGKGLGMLLLFEAAFLGRERGVERLRSAAAASNASEREVPSMRTCSPGTTMNSSATGRRKFESGSSDLSVG